jgi:hypothetical protein
MGALATWQVGKDGPSKYASHGLKGTKLPLVQVKLIGQELTTKTIT